MNLILLGPPGSGKGTQAGNISKILNIVHISTGEMFREAVETGSEIGKELNSYMTKGKLVPDEVVISIVKERLSRDDVKKGFLLDGFPRTINQAKALDSLLLSLGKSIDKVIYLYLSDNEIIKRLTNRRVCSVCGLNYNLISQPPKEPNQCDKCGGTLIQRSDDNPETIKQRVKVYNEQTQPLIEYYEKADNLLRIDSSKPISEVFKDICVHIGR